MHKYTPKEIRFIESKIAGRTKAELTELFNMRFKTSVSFSSMQSLCFSHGITGSGKAHKYTAKEIKFLSRKAAGRSYAELTALFNKRFGLSMTVNQIGSTLKRFNLSNGRDCRFRPGQTPFNKGKKKWWVGGEATQFKPGQMPHNYLPVGSERITRDGYAEIKIRNPKTWKAKHIIIWEKAHGKVLKGSVVIFADGNRLNLKLKNLLMVSRAELAMMNHLGLISTNAEITKVGKTIADIKIKISERKKGMNKKAKSKGVKK
jgi:hypothetical protein